MRNSNNMKTQTIALTIAATFVFCLGTPVPPTDDEPWLNYDPSSDTPSNSGSSQSGSSSSSSSGSSSSSSSDQSSSSSSSDSQSSLDGSSSSNSVQVIGYSFSNGPISAPVEELPARPGDFQDIFIRQPEGPGNFQDAFIRHLQQQEQQQQPDFLPNAPTGDEIIFVDESPETIQIYVEDQPSLPSTSTGRRGGQGPPTGRPEACLKKKSKEQEAGPSPKKPKTKNIAGGCEIIYIDSGRETPEDVHLVCTSNTGERQSLAVYEAVECPNKNNENDIETPQTTEMPRDFEHNPEDDDDHDPSQRRANVAQFNDKLTLALLQATQGQLHNCVQLVELQNKTTARRQRRFIWIFGPAIALVIAAIAIEHEASKVPQCPNGYIRYASHCIKEGQSDNCPRGFVDLRFVKKLSK